MIESGVYLTPYGGSGRQMKPRVTENCFAALVRTFKTSDHFLKDLRPASQALWGSELDFACRPNLLGAISLDEIRPALVQQYLDGWSDKPGKQAAALAAFRALEKWAIVRALLARPITLGVETGKPTGSHVPGLMSRGRSRNQMPEMICAESSRLEPILDNAPAILCAWLGR